MTEKRCPDLRRDRKLYTTWTRGKGREEGNSDLLVNVVLHIAFSDSNRYNFYILIPN